MATTAQVILDAAIDSSLANDDARTDLASDTTELLNVLNRKLAHLYTLAAMPVGYGGAGRGDFFQDSANVTLGASYVALPTAAFKHTFVLAVAVGAFPAGTRVSAVPQADMDDDVADLPPAVVVQGNTVKGAGRSGDPGNGHQLTVRYTSLPGTLTLTSHFIGATTPTDASTSRWPEAVGNPFLIAWLARYLAIKAGDREPDEVGAIERDLQEASVALGQVIGVAATRLTDMRAEAEAA